MCQQTDTHRVGITCFRGTFYRHNFYTVLYCTFYCILDKTHKNTVCFYNKKSFSMIYKLFSPWVLKFLLTQFFILFFSHNIKNYKLYYPCSSKMHHFLYCINNYKPGAHTKLSLSEDRQEIRCCDQSVLILCLFVFVT